MGIYIIAKIVVKQAALDAIKPIFKELVNKSQGEQGCIQYDLHQSLTEQNVFFMYECWKDEAAIQQHNNSAHFQQFKQHAGEYVENLEISTLEKLAL